MDCKQVRLWQGVVDFENFREVVDGTMSTIQSKASLLLEASRGVDTHGDALAVVFALGHGFDILKVADRPCEQLRY